MNKRVIYLFLLTVALIALGFVRESLFTHINTQIYHFEEQNGYMVEGSFYEWLFSVFTNAPVLNTLKWGLTLVFTATFFVLTILGIRVFYKTKKYDLLIGIIFISIVFCAGVSFGIDMVIGSSLDKGYRFARIFMGAVQSPFILLLMIPGIKLLSKRNLS